MHFYEVAPASRQYRGASNLTYHHDQKLTPGGLVIVKVRSNSHIGLIIKEVPKPKFKTLPIEETSDKKISLEKIQLLEWMRGYYPSSLGATTGLFLPLGNNLEHYKKNSELIESTKKNTPLKDLPDLTKEQAQALKIIDSSAKPILLHGETGSGKTRVYQEITKKVLNSGKSVLILVPEISLSPQMIKSFAASSAKPVFLLHSNLTSVQKRKTWQAISACQSCVVIGPRSALFSPLQNLGLVVVDECHEPAYKQDQAPYYQTIRVASMLSSQHGAKLILGSATPPVSEHFIFEQKKLPIVRLTQKAVATQNNQNFKLNTIIADMSIGKQRTSHSLISKSLLDALESTLSRGEQALIFLNKRGSARLIVCQSCGWRAKCPHCDVPLTYHKDSHKLQCHTCGFTKPAENSCPECGSPEIIFKAPGTKTIAESLQRQFPDAKVARFDQDNSKEEKLENRHSEITSGKIDILVGTQLLAKGHDLPKLSLVGILLAENELQFPDYSSSERSYQLIKQLAGRVGRGHLPGTVVAQTFDVNNLAVQTALKPNSWQKFYESQLIERQTYAFPPYYFLMKIEVNKAKLNTVKSSCQKIIKFLNANRANNERFIITGPAPCFSEKRGGKYHWQIIVKSKSRQTLTRLASKLPSDCSVNLDPNDLL